ncbi:MAG: hypothetical protein KBT36_03070 [Kurthia sp.]|nr:hypothetical protein [Candidatus Kurthia equi]
MSIIVVLLFTVPVISDAQANKKAQFIFTNATTPTYKKAGKDKLNTKLSPSVYKQYGKSGKWIKVKKSNGQYVWISSSKKLTSIQSTKYKKMEKEIMNLVNIERKKRGLTKLQQSNHLQQITYLRNYDLAKENYFEHTSPKYGRWANFLYTSEYDFAYAGENIAAGFVTAKGFVNAWMNSPTHRANILNPRFKKIAVGVSDGTSKSYFKTYATQWFSD